MASVLTST